MLSVENISLFFGERPILRRMSFMVAAGERVCLVGPNGAGKSTLLKVCAGELSAEEGSVNKPNDAAIGYLPQDVDLPGEIPLLEEVMSVFAAAQEALDEMRDLEHKMGEVDHASDEFTEIAERYDFLQHEVTRLDAWTAEARTARVLHGLGFAATDYDKPCGSFSGGWRMRAALAKVLLRQPEIMLLDEPTNYLDIETMLWLEQWLKASTSAILFVSHERAFMDNLADRVIEVAAGQHSFFKGNYTNYLELRQERREKQQAAFENQQSRIKQIEDYAAKFRAKARRASGVQSRLKEIDRMDIVEAPPSDPSTIRFRFPPAPRGNKIALELRNVSKSFGDKQVLKDIDFQLVRGEKVAIVGMNGAGKSTLIKLLAGDHQPDSGEVKAGDMTALSYFAQDQLETLSPSNSVYDELLAKSVAGQGNYVRDLAGAFLFKGDDIDKPVGVLSGGEKTRLRIAKMLMGTSNCLLLDEPTNHLDVQARGVLERALKNYDGAFLIVSHDRVFVDQVATKIYEVKDGAVSLFPGTYADYVEQLQDENEELGSTRKGQPGENNAGENQESENGSARPNSSGPKGAAPKKSKKSASAANELNPREARKQLKKLDAENDELEEKSAELEEEITRIEMAMTEPGNYSDGAKMSRLTKRLAAERKSLDKVMDRWVRLEEEREKLEELAEL